MDELEAMTHTRRRLIFTGGAVAGLVGGVLVAALLGLTRAAHGQDFWTPLKVAAYPFMGDRTLHLGFDAAAVGAGLLAHLVVSAIWGVLFAAFTFGLPRWATVGFGAAWGLIVLFVMTYLVLPLSGAMRVEDGMAVRPAVVEHLVFGLVVGLAFLPFQRPEPRQQRWVSRTA